MKYSFSAVASRIAVFAVLSTVGTIGSAVPAAAGPSQNAPAVVPVCPPQSVIAVAEHALEALLFGAPDPCALTASASSSKDAEITGPVHPITYFLNQLI